MSHVSELKRCPKCSGPISAEAPQGLCPKCLLQQACVPTEAGKGESAKAAPPTLEELAAAFPQLEILQLIGQGGMGFVFKARQPTLDRFVALKILPQSLAADPAFAERFTREGRMLARLNHPNIVALYEFGRAELPLGPNIGAAQQRSPTGIGAAQQRSPTGQTYFFLMEYVDGVNLRQAMKVGRFTPAQALSIVPKICEALQFAHNEGILHRDIKPENILLDTKGRVKIADFGIAKMIGSEPGRAELPLSPGIGEQHSPTGIIGTPQYMAPEQLEHPQDVDQRADIYSLGVVFYEMLTGELPLGRFAPPSEKSAVDPRVDQVVLRTLEKERDRRTQSAGEVKTQLETISTTSQPPPNKAMDAAVKANPSSASPRIAPTIRAWSPLAVSSALLVLLVVFLGLCLKYFYPFPASYSPFPMFLANCGLACSLAAPALGALALWDFGAGSNRRGLALALFGTFSGVLTLINSLITLPCIYLLFPSIGVNQSTTIYSLEFISWMLLQSSFVVGELWILMRVWNRFAAANGLSRESLRNSRSFSGELLSEKRVAGWWKASAWAFIMVGAFELTTVIAYLFLHSQSSFTIAHITGLSSDRGFANVFAGLALLTLNPRWRTAAIVTMWFAAVSLAFGLASLPNGPESAAISLSGLFLRFCDQPIEHVLGEVVGFGLIVWPYWMLTSPRGKATFGLATKR